MESAKVSETEAELAERCKRTSLGRPSHWLSNNADSFHNPWPSWRYVNMSDNYAIFKDVVWNYPHTPSDAKDRIPSRKPVFEQPAETSGKIKATWLGHSCFLVEFPRKEGSPQERGARVLFDPVFSDVCFSIKWLGPKRYTPPPCTLDELPELDLIVISHNHYDHLDTPTIQHLFSRESQRTPHIFAPLGNRPYFLSLGIPASHIHILDWWESLRVQLPYLRDTELDVICTPSQHYSARGILDRFKTLWASWAVTEIKGGGKEGVKVWHAGDTGYRAVKLGQDEDSVPVCPAFKEIGERFGGFDLALIPIGAYLPRRWMSPIHCAPQDSVRIFEEIKAERAIGMHWGTWVLTWEEVDAPPKKLAEECKKIGIENGAFTVCELGETILV